MYTALVCENNYWTCIENLTDLALALLLGFILYKGWKVLNKAAEYDENI